MALNRPSSQSSVYTADGREHGPSLGNDGRHTGQDSVLSDNETNPWWAVQLRQSLVVTRLDLTNVDDFGESKTKQ